MIRTLKPLSNTRWTCRADSTKALRENYKAIREALGRFSNDPEEKGDARREATSLCAHLDKLETAMMTILCIRRFKVETYNVILDKLLSCLANTYTELNELFSVLFNTDSDCDSVRKCAAALSTIYSDDLDKDFGEELIQFKTFVQEEKKTFSKDNATASTQTWPPKHVSKRLCCAQDIPNPACYKC